MQKSLCQFDESKQVENAIYELVHEYFNTVTKPINLFYQFRAITNRALLEKSLDSNNGNQSKTARDLGISRCSLRKYMNELNIKLGQ